jgi:hypothetical protein
MSYTIEFTMKGKTSPSKTTYDTKMEAYDAWDKVVDDALGGDKMRLIDNTTGRIISEYNPVDRSGT